MIYIAQAGKAICQAPCMLCKCGADACNSVCKGCGGACHNCSEALSDMWAPIVQNPLGGYVLGTWGAMIVAIAASVYSYSQITANGCDELKTFLLAEVAIGVIHAVFAFYIQRKLVSAILKSASGDGSTTTTGEVTDKAKELIKYDIGLCLYVFFFIAAFAYNCYAVGDVGKCPTPSYSKAAVAIMIVFGIGAFNFAFCWYCGQCCYGKAGKSKKVVKLHGGPAPEAVGAMA